MRRKREAVITPSQHELMKPKLSQLLHFLLYEVIRLVDRGIPVAWCVCMESSRPLNWFHDTIP